MCVVVHDDEDVIPENGLVRSFTIRLRVLTFALKSSLEVEREGALSLVPPPGLTAVAASAPPLVSLKLAVLLAPWVVLLLVEIQQ